MAPAPRSSKTYYLYAAVVFVSIVSIAASWFDVKAVQLVILSTGLEASTKTIALPALIDEKISYIAACIIIKNQNQDFLEWMLYHNMLGVERFYVFDHMSQPPLQQAPHVGSFIASGLIEYIYFDYQSDPDTVPKQLSPQFQAYQTCIDKYRHRHQWMMFFDTDEFLVLGNNDTLVNALEMYEPYGGLVVNWRIFGSSNHKRRPAGGALENYLSCFPATESRHQNLVKTIANCDNVVSTAWSPHHFEYKNGSYAVDEFYQPVDGAIRANATTGNFILHHYVFKSREDFERKMKRGSARNGNGKDESFYQDDKKATDTCTAGLELSQRLKRFVNTTYGFDLFDSSD